MKFRRFAAAFTAAALLFSSAQSLRAEESEEWTAADHAGILFLDAFIPGYGAWRLDSAEMAVLIAGLRLVTARAAYDSWKKRELYRDSYRAARYADLYYGPGLAYYDTAGRGYKTSFQFETEMKKQNSYYTLSMSAHAAAAVFSLAWTWKKSSAKRKKIVPTFEISPDAVGMRLTLLDF